jgi:hypothetical protein
MGRRKIKNSSLESSLDALGMAKEEALAAFETLAKTLDVEVRYEKGDFISGLYRLYDEHVILIQKDFSAIKKIYVLARELCTFDLEKIYIMPQLLAILKQARSEVISEESISLEEK